MSQENVEIAKRGIDAFNRPGSGAFAALMTGRSAGSSPRSFAISATAYS
jgi:hypothetical protein